jgi:predicted phage replisome organizer
LKLKNDFFNQREVKKLRKVAGGDTFTIIYLKMQLLSIKNEGVITFEKTEDNLAEQLSIELDEDLENIELTLAFLIKNNLIEKLNDEDYLLNKVQQSIGSESESAERVRRLRNKKKDQKALHCNGDVTKSNTEIELEKELELEKETEKKTSRLKFETFDMQLATKLYDMMKENNDGVKKPNFDNWANEVRLMRERDNRTEEQIDYVIEYSQKDTFWSTVVLSVKSLRKNFDKIVVQIKKNKQNKRVEKRQDTSYNEVSGTDIDLM